MGSVGAGGEQTTLTGYGRERTPSTSKLGRQAGRRSEAGEGRGVQRAGPGGQGAWLSRHEGVASVLGSVQWKAHGVTGAWAGLGMVPTGWRELWLPHGTRVEVGEVMGLVTQWRRADRLAGRLSVRMGVWDMCVHVRLCMCLLVLHVCTHVCD